MKSRNRDGTRTGTTLEQERLNSARDFEEYVIGYFTEITNRTPPMDAILLWIFTHIDLMGYLYTGKSKSSNAVQFMREYLGKVDVRYKEVSGLLYHALRHGYVHLATPKRIRLSGGELVDFVFVIAQKRQEHLQVKRQLELLKTGQEVNIYQLSLDWPLLYKDMLAAMKIFAEDIKHNQEVSKVFRDAFRKRRNPDEARGGDLKRKYISQSDFDFLRVQISKLQKNK